MREYYDSKIQLEKITGVNYDELAKINRRVEGMEAVKQKFQTRLKLPEGKQYCDYRDEMIDALALEIAVLTGLCDRPAEKQNFALEDEQRREAEYEREDVHEKLKELGRKRKAKPYVYRK